MPQDIINIPSSFPPMMQQTCASAPFFGRACKDFWAALKVKITTKAMVIQRTQFFRYRRCYGYQYFELGRWLQSWTGRCRRDLSQCGDQFFLARDVHGDGIGDRGILEDQVMAYYSDYWKIPSQDMARPLASSYGASRSFFPRASAKGEAGRNDTTWLKAAFTGGRVKILVERELYS